MRNNNEYTSCGRLINGVDFELDTVEVCCYRCHEGKGSIELAQVNDGKIDFDIFDENRKKLIKNVSPKCKGCFNLETKAWNTEPKIKYIHFNHWSMCGSDCIYCYTKTDNKYKNGVQHYSALPLLKELINRYGFSPDGEVTFAGGEPVQLKEFDVIIEYLLEIGAKKIIVHTSAVIYSKALEKALQKGAATVVISHDSGTNETYKRIKNTDFYERVWDNTKKYSQNGQVFSKYVVLPKLNDNKEEVQSWLKKAVDSGIKSVIVDIEHNYYENNKNNPSIARKLISFCEYIKETASSLGCEVELYNAAKYLYSKYKIYSNLIQYKKYIKGLSALAIPILVGSIGHTIIGATDVLVVARYNINSLAAISIANAILFTIIIFGFGVQDAISVILSNKRGAKENIKKYLNTTLLFSIVLACIFAAISYSTVSVIDKFSFEAEIVPYIKQYIKIVSLSMFGMFIFQGIKQFLQAYEIVKFPNFIILVSSIINLFLDIVLVFGFRDIIPAMGSKGAAVATLSVRTLMGFIILCYIFKFIERKHKVYLDYIGSVLKIGAPIGFSLLVEFLAFNLVTVLIGREAGILAATHNILLTISSVTFNVPLAVAIALSVKVAYNYGANNLAEIKKYSYTGLFMGVSFMAFCGIILALFPRQAVGLFTQNSEVMNIALPLVMIVAMYQVFDGFQVVAGGILRGFKMTKAAFCCVFSGYWIFAMPVAYILVSKYSMSLKGYWIALAVAIFTMGLTEAIIAKYKFNKIKQMN